MSRQISEGDAVDGRQVSQVFAQPAQAFTMAATDAHLGKKPPFPMQRCQAMTQQVHAAVGVFAIDHATAAKKLRQGAPLIIGATQQQAAMVATAAVRQFIARAAEHPDLTAQSCHQRIAAGLRQQQVRG
ncbi:hypothetical protein D3C87_1447910 [compost metagenome]